MLNKTLSKLTRSLPAADASAHCDGPCGVYDPASARIAGEAALSMTKKLAALEPPHGGTPADWAHYNNHFARYVAIKEEQTHIAKSEILVLWTDYFKPHHLEAYPDLHNTIWKATKLASSVKVNVSIEAATGLMAAIKEIHEIFWATKNRKVEWYTAS